MKVEVINCVFTDGDDHDNMKDNVVSKVAGNSEIDNLVRMNELLDSQYRELQERNIVLGNKVNVLLSELFLMCDAQQYHRVLSLLEKVNE